MRAALQPKIINFFLNKPSTRRFLFLEAILLPFINAQYRAFLGKLL